jgi:hypothetical protein
VVCVAIPVRNGADYLPQAIESVLAQEGVDLEVRIRDNGSDDGSVAIAESYSARDPRVSVAVNEENIFYYGSLNRILAETEAEWFAPFAHDDLMRPGNLAAKLETLEREGARFAHSTGVLVDEHGQVTGESAGQLSMPPVIDPPDFFLQIAPDNQVLTQSVLVHTDALRAVGGFDARSLYAGDWLTWMRLALRERVVTLHEPLSAIRVHSAAGTAQSNAAGFNGRDLPATLDRMFRDPAMPADWQGLRPAFVAGVSTSAARVLHADGIRRVEQGWAAYMLVGRALALQPHGQGLRSLYETFVSESGLVPPRLPFEAVALAPGDAGEAAALAAAVTELGELLGQLAIAVEEGRAEEAMALLEPHFGESSLDVALLPTGQPAELLRPGRIALARWGGEFVAQAEAAAVPVYPYAMPDPFADPPDPSAWQTVDPAACLP